MELGSEYSLRFSDLTVKKNNIFQYLSCYHKQCFFDSGRSALKHLVSFFCSKDEVLLPEFICESVTNCFNGLKIKFYKIKQDFSVDVDSIESQISKDTRSILLMHYFGSIQPLEQLQRINNIARKHNLIIIEDTTHSIFSKSDTIGDYQICSIRKWMPIPSGGVLYSKNDPLDVFDTITYKSSIDNDRSYGMVLKELFLSTGLDCNLEYRKIFTECEDKIDRQNDIYLLSDFARFIASCVDILNLKNNRTKNFHYLNEELIKKGVKSAIQLNSDDCPLVLPLRVKKRDQFRAFLMDNRIYCAVHWPFDGIMKEHRVFADECAQKLISLPIDQRYERDDIDYMIDVISRYGEEL